MSTTTSAQVGAPKLIPTGNASRSALTIPVYVPLSTRDAIARLEELQFVKIASHNAIDEAVRNAGTLSDRQSAIAALAADAQAKLDALGTEIAAFVNARLDEVARQEAAIEALNALPLY